MLHEEVPKLTVFVFSINFVVILCHFSCTSWQSSSIFLLDVLKYGVVVLAGARRFSHIGRKREIGQLHIPISLNINATKIHDWNEFRTIY